MKDISLQFKKFLHTDGQEYFAKNHVYADLPIISGIPQIKINNYRLKVEGHFRNKYNLRIPIVKIIKTPEECRIQKIINYDIDKFGSLIIGCSGTFGSGKTNLVNGLVGFLTANNCNIIYCVDRRFEVRHLAFYGVWKNNIFIPFKINIFIPKGFKFLRGNFLWEERPKNVFLHEIENISDVLEYKEKYTINCIYTEAFTPQSILSLFLELSRLISLKCEIEDHYFIVHQEIETILENSPEKDKFKLTEEFSKAFINFRKDHIGFLCAFHEKSEVYWKNSDKFTVMLVKRPVLKKTLSKAEEDNKTGGRSSVNISISGYWTKHKIRMFPEVNDKYRCIPSDQVYELENGKIILSTKESNSKCDPLTEGEFRK